VIAGRNLLDASGGKTRSYPREGALAERTRVLILYAHYRD
jgi:hypothetical protein